MLEARKENKVYTIDERQKDAYLKQGFDIYKNGKVIEYTPLKTIKYSDHINKIKEIKELEAKAVIPETVMETLLNYAKNKNIDVGQTTSPNGVLAKILEAEKTEE